MAWAGRMYLVAVAPVTPMYLFWTKLTWLWLKFLPPLKLPLVLLHNVSLLTWNYILSNFTLIFLSTTTGWVTAAWTAETDNHLLATMWYRRFQAENNQCHLKEMKYTNNLITVVHCFRYLMCLQHIWSNFDNSVAVTRSATDQLDTSDLYRVSASATTMQRRNSELKCGQGTAPADRCPAVHNYTACFSAFCIECFSIWLNLVLN